LTSVALTLQGSGVNDSARRRDDEHLRCRGAAAPRPPRPRHTQAAGRKP